MAFCRWYDKQFENVSEHEQEQCKENGQDCRTCPDLIADSKQAAAVAADYIDNHEIICDKCAATFTPDMIEVQNRVITQDEEHNDIIEQYYECPICGTHYTITITDRVQRLSIQKRRQLQTAVKNAIRAGRPARAQTYKEKERELADDIQARAKMLKEQYTEYTEE